MKQLICLITLLAVYSSVFADTTDTRPLVGQTFAYKTSKAGEMYFVWTMDNWKIPDAKYQPPGTYVTNNMAYTKMNRVNDSFYLTLQLPEKIYLDFMFWASKDNKGDSLQGWDTNWESNYNFYVDGKDTVKVLNDEKLGIAVKTDQNVKEKPFNILEQGRVILAMGISIFIFSFLVRLILKRKDRLLTLNYFLGGLIFSSLLLMSIVRYQLNNNFTGFSLLPGLAYYDILFIVCFSSISFSLLYITRNILPLHRILQLSLILIILSATLACILNIEVVRKLGKPLTYNWLYYSDFLQGSDAKNAIKAGFNQSMIKNLQFIMAGFLLTGSAFAIMSKLFFKNRKQLAFTITSLVAVVFLVSFIQFKNSRFDDGKVLNPVSAMLLSWIDAGDKFQLFTMDIPDKVKAEIEQMHSWKKEDQLPYADSITSVVVFVLESTPASLVSVYDSTYKVTPNLNFWKRHAKVYNNMYAHLPTTANTMLSIVSGIYPMINYKTIVNEYPAIKIPSLPATLKAAGWNTSLFFSSDLFYSNMGVYLKNQMVETAEDFKTIPCGYRKFSTDYALLEGLDDRCIVERYFNWRQNISNVKSFSILWSNQTHYPYFFSGEAKKFAEDVELNKYLNALEEVDNAFGNLMNGLEQRGELDNTLVIVTGDHGEAFGTHGQYAHGANIYEENMKVPCMLINPILFKNERDDRISGMIDIASTITHITGTLPAKDWQGTSLLSSYKRDHAFFIGPYSDFQFGSRFKNWKLIFNAANNKFKLFDLGKDPGELNDVSNDNKKIIEEEFKLMAGWVQYHNAKLKTLLK